MLSSRLKNYCDKQGWWFDDESPDYAVELIKLGAPKNSDFAEFFGHVEDGPTFISRGKEIFQIGWFSKNTDFSLNLKRAREVLGLSSDYLPLDSFEGETGFFYNLKTDEVFELSLGSVLKDFHAGRISARWVSFNSFLEDFFEIT